MALVLATYLLGESCIISNCLAGVQLYMLAPLLTPSKGIWNRASSKFEEVPA